jgi:hypothetical protein
LFGSLPLTLTHVEPHTVPPPGHAQEPALHICPLTEHAVQDAPPRPHAVVSLATATHALPLQQPAQLVVVSQ